MEISQFVAEHKATWAYGMLLSEKQAMRLAYAMATASPDPSTQNGAVLLDARSRVIGVGYNGFPPGVKSTPERWERPLKYSYVWHAEDSAMYDAVRRQFWVQGGVLVCPWQACAECAKAIVGMGVKTIVRIKRDASNPSWDGSVTIGDTILVESDVDIEEVDWVFPDREKILRNGVLV